MLATDPPPRASGETYFFRDHGQFDLLRLRLLPELIARHRATKTLRLWSAGCASGEEAYSLAMLVDMLLPGRDDWNILILGSDIDPVALDKARRARYGQWSFRMVPPVLQHRYFEHRGGEWALDERIRRMVTFRAVDLIGESLPAGESRDMDLILCRNVFIYFGAHAVAAAANKLASALSVGGYLMTGHTELIGHRVGNLRSRLFAEGVVYQRVEQVHHTPPPQPSPALRAREGVLKPPSPLVLKNPDPSWAKAHVGAAPNLEDQLARARDFADRGEYDRAEQACRQTLAVAPLASGPHFLLAQLAQLKGDFERAGELLEKTLYIDPGCVAAYLELAALCERGDNPRRAQTLRRAALDIVRALPGDAPVEPYGASAAEMVTWLAQ